ncbi:MAG: hypothetical protein WC556_13745 [Candidatus Methanoperedens sp.]
MRGVDAFLFDHVCYFRCDGRGLASACACEDQGRGLGLFEREESWGQIKGEEEADKYIPQKTICETADERR